MKEWNFGIIGASFIAELHANAINSLPNAKVVGFCDAGSGRAGKLAEKFGAEAFGDYHKMLESDRVDIVTVATPSGAHLEPVLAAAKAGKHVVCEKPLEITLEKIDKMIEAHQKSGTCLGGIFQNRFADAMAPLKEAIDSGRFGKISYAGVYVPWWRSEDYYKDSWHGTWLLDGGGALMNQSIHMIDMLCMLMPKVQSVQAFVGTLGHSKQNMETEDTSVAAVRFVDGALGLIYGTTASWPGQLKRFEVTGTKGTAVFVEDCFTVWQFADERKEDEDIRQRFSQSSGQGGAGDPNSISFENHARNFKAFVDVLQTGEEFCLGGAEAKKSVELILAIYKSAKEGCPVELE